MLESSRVIIETVEDHGDGMFGTTRHESASHGEINVGFDLAEVVSHASPRKLLVLAEAAVELSHRDEYEDDKASRPDESEFVAAAERLIAAWKAIDGEAR